MDTQKTVSKIETNLQIYYSEVRVGFNLDVVTPKDVLMRIIAKLCEGRLADIQEVHGIIDTNSSLKNQLLRNLDSLIQEDKRSVRATSSQLTKGNTRGFASMLVSLVTMDIDPLGNLVASNLEAIEATVLASLKENVTIHKDNTRGGHILLALMQVLNPNHQHNSKFSFDSVLDRVVLPQGTTRTSVRDMVSKIFNSSYDTLVTKFVSTMLYDFISESLREYPDSQWSTVKDAFISTANGLPSETKQSLCNSVGKELYDSVRVSANMLHLYPDMCYQEGYTPAESYNVTCDELFKNKGVFISYLGTNNGIIKDTMTKISSNHKQGRPLSGVSLFLKAVSELEDNPTLFESRTTVASYVKKLPFDAVSLTVG